MAAVRDVVVTQRRWLGRLLVVAGYLWANGREQGTAGGGRPARTRRPGALGEGRGCTTRRQRHAVRRTRGALGYRWNCWSRGAGDARRDARRLCPGDRRIRGLQRATSGGRDRTDGL